MDSEVGRSITVTVSSGANRPNMFNIGEIVKFKRKKRLYGIITKAEQYSCVIKGGVVAAPKSTIRRKSVFSKHKDKIKSTEFYLNIIKQKQQS